MNRTLSIILAGLILLSPMLVSAASDELSFQQAMKYTVKIRTRVRIPFIGDRKGTQTGAGFVVDSKRGWILTNAHVVARSPSDVKVLFRGGSFLTARKLYVDPFVDLAVIVIPKRYRPKALYAARLECRQIPAVGHPVGAFGHPWNLSFTGTRGIISGITSKYTYKTEMIQTDAPINPGNSGGPLISLKSGKVVGISTASRRFSQNTNFAVPMKNACDILRLLKNGVDPSPPELPYMFYSDVDETKKLVVAKVHQERNRLGLREGDIIDRVPGITGSIKNKGQLVHALRGRLNNFHLRIIRNGKPVMIRGSLAPARKISQRSGIFVSGLLFGHTPWMDAENFINGKPKIMIHYVEKGSIGDGQRIRMMDLLLAVNGKKVTDLKELYRLFVTAHKNKTKVSIKFIRLGSIRDELFSYLIRPLSLDKPVYIGSTP